MDLRYSKQDEAFRSELRAWLAREVPAHGLPPKEGDWPARRAYDTGWQRKLFEGGYAGINWPTEYGGRGAPLSEQLVYYEEIARANAPYVGVNFVGMRDAGDPVELAARYDLEGADELVFLDITASSDFRDTTVDMVRRTAEEVFIPFTVGGGIRSVEDARVILRAGADKVSINTAAVDRPELVAELAAEFGSQCVVVAVDARRSDGVNSGFEVFTHGGRTATGWDAVAWVAEVVGREAGEVLCTSMDRDGTRDGYDVEMLRAVGAVCPVPLIASGGAGSLDHLVEGVTEGGADAVLAASIFHFGEHSVAEAKEHLAAAGVAVRPPGA